MSDHARLAAWGAAEWGLPAPEHIRTSSNSLFAAGDDIVLRVGVLPFGVAAELDWIATMSRLDVRLPTLRRDVIERDGVAVMALERIHPHGTVDWCEVGAMVGRVHGIHPRPSMLPFCADMQHWQFDRLLADVADLIDEPAMDGIEACLHRWSGWAGRAFDGRVVCHGDVHPGNVLPTVDGPVLIDWDLRCLGPAGWDHAPMMMWTERWGGEPGLYESFAEGYGQSLRGEWMAEAMAELRLLAATLMRLRAGRNDAVAAEEAQRRLRWWRGDTDAPTWVAH